MREGGKRGREGGEKGGRGREGEKEGERGREGGRERKYLYIIEYNLLHMYLFILKGFNCHASLITSCFGNYSNYLANEYYYY